MSIIHENPEIEETGADTWEGLRWVDVRYKWDLRPPHGWPCSLLLRVASDDTISVIGLSTPRIEYTEAMERIARDHARAHVLPRVCP